MTSNVMSNHLSYHNKAYYNKNNKNIFLQCKGEYRSQHAKHLYSYLMGEGACQRDILDRPSCGLELTCETIPISIGDSKLQLHWKVLNILSMYGRV